MIWRRSWSASWALSRMTPAARATSAGGASGRNSRAPAWTLRSVRRWASTSCISRAMASRAARWACCARSLRPRPGAAGPFAEGGDELAAGPHEHAPADDQEQQEETGDEVDQRRELGVRPYEALHHVACQSGAADDGESRERHPHGGAEHGDEERAAARRGRWSRPRRWRRARRRASGGGPRGRGRPRPRRRRRRAAAAWGRRPCSTAVTATTPTSTARTKATVSTIQSRTVRRRGRPAPPGPRPPGRRDPGARRRRPGRRAAARVLRTRQRLPNLRRSGRG